jgi:putative transposase
MAGFGLRKHMVFDWKGGTFRIERLQPNGDVLLEAVESGALSIVPREHLLKEFAEGAVSATSETAKQPRAVPLYSRPLEDLPASIQQELRRRRAYLAALQEDGAPVFTVRHVAPIVEKVAAEIQDSKPPSASTVYRWYKRLQSRGDNRALIPRTDRRGIRAGLQCVRIQELVAEATAEAFKTTPLANVPNIYSRLLTKIELENRQALAPQPLKAPSIRTVYRMLASSNAYEMTALKEGKASADRRFRVGKAGATTHRILERIEIDHTPLDLFLVDERTWLPLGRPTLTVALDHYSRMPWGYYLSYGSPSAAAVVGALRHGILPKPDIAQAIDKLPVENRWPTYGLPETLVADNGLEFHGIDLESIAFDLGFVVVFCPKHQPRFKGSIERYLKTINYFFAHQIPGASFARFYQRGDYDPQKCALLTLGEFKHLFEKWVVDVYAQTKHSGIGTTPWRRWHEGLAAQEPQLPADLRVLQQRIGLSASRKLRRSGFELHGIRYNDGSLGHILRRYGEGVQIRIVFDPEDLGEVQVWGPDDADPISVQALDLSYAKGLTQRQNELIRQLVREEGASIEDAAALQRARRDIAQSVSELMTSRKQKARHRSAAMRGISSSQPNGTTGAIDFPSPSTRQLTQKRPATSAAASAEIADMPVILPAFRIPSVKRGGHGSS